MTRSVRSSFVAFRYRNFRLIWMAMVVSFIGSFMQTAAILWHVAQIMPPGRKALALGFVGLARIVPIVGLSLPAGVVADAWDRRRLLALTQAAAALNAIGLAVVAFKGVTSAWPIYAFAAVASCTDAFDRPARQALVPSLVPREHLPNALSLNTIMMQLGAVCGPALAGIVIAATDIGWVYAINAVSFVVVIGALFMMRDVPASATTPGLGRNAFTVHAAVEGLHFVFRSPMIRSTMLLDFFASFFSSAMTLLPIFAQDILRVGPQGYGWLYSAPAAGAVVTGLAMVLLIDRIERRGMMFLAAVGVYGLATIVFGMSRSFWLTFACLFVTGAADIVSVVIRHLVRQLETPDGMRGRMIGINMVFFMGGPQLGELEAGLVANWVGAPLSVVSGGVGCLIAVSWIAASTPALRHYGQYPTPTAAPTAR